MALRWIDTAWDEDGNPTGEGYNIDDSSGDVYDNTGSQLDQTTAEPMVDYYSPGDYQNTTYTGDDLKKIQAAVGTTKDISSISNLPNSIAKSFIDRYTTNGVTDWAKVGADALKAGAAIHAYNAASAPTPKTGYQGGIPALQAVRQQLTPQTAEVRPGAGGQRYFTDTQYTTAAGLPAAQTASEGQATVLDARNLRHQQAQVAQAPTAPTSEQQQAASDKFFGRVSVPPPMPAVKQAAQGGLMGLAHGGSTTHPGGTYLRGPTDGMADKIHATIDGNQPARLAHGEFVIPADVVSHLGNGNSDAGANQLYRMMDKIRKARTGTTKQGKEINPDKFTLGGIAGYAGGGHIPGYAGATDGSVVGAASGVTGTESNLSNWAGPYVTNMLGQGQALANEPYQAYQGPLTAGASDLQTQAFGNAANLSTPTSIGAAANTAGRVGTEIGDLSYSPTTATNQFNTPTTSGYTAGTSTAATAGTTATSDAATAGPAATSNAAQAAGPSQVTTQNWATPGTAESYMSPYQQNVVNAQQREAQRTADVATTGRQAEQTRAGAFGGSRSAIMDAEAARNLALQKGDIQASGLQSAYASGQAQFNAQQNASLAAQQANQNAGVTVGGQNLSAAQQTALANQAATNQGAQFNANLGQQTALANQAAGNQASQFTAGQNLTAAQTAAQYGQAAQAQNEQAGQFGANYGLQALQGELGAAQTQGNLGATQNATGLANLNTQLGAGATQQGINQQGVAADQAAFNAERDNPYKMVQFQQSLLQGLPLAAQSYSITNNPVTAAAGALSAVNTALKP